MTELSEKPVKNDRDALESALEKVDENIVGTDGDPRCNTQGWYEETIRADFIEAHVEDARRQIAEDLEEMGQNLAEVEKRLQGISGNNEGPAEKHITLTRLLIIGILFGIGYFGSEFFSKLQREKEHAACALLQKGQPLPDAPNEVQMPDADSLYKLVEICEQNHSVDITYGCAAEGILHTAGLKHEPSEISEDIKAEALRIAKEIKCNR